MFKKLFMLFKIGRKLSLSGAISSIYEIYNPPIIIKIFFSIFGRKILIATSFFSVESLIVAKCTCAIDAAAIESEKFYSQEDFFKELKKKNFTNVSYKNLYGGIVAIHSGWKI